MPGAFAAFTALGLGFAGALGCGGAGEPGTGSTTPVDDAIAAVPSMYALEQAILATSPILRCEPAVFASGDVMLATQIDGWLTRDELGRGTDELTVPSSEAFRVGLDVVLVDRARSLSGSRASARIEGAETRFSFAEASSVPDEPVLGRLDYVVRASGDALVGAFCRHDRDDVPLTCRYAAITADGETTPFGEPLAPLVDVLLVPMPGDAGATDVVVGHEIVDEVTLPRLVVDYVDSRAHTLRRVRTGLDAPTSFFGVSIEGDALRVLALDDGTWRQAEVSGAAGAASPPALDAVRACRDDGGATTRVRIPLRVSVGDVALHLDEIVPPTELACGRDAAGPCGCRLEIATREGGTGSTDGAIGGVLATLPGAPDRLSGALSTWFGRLEADCALED